MIIIGYQGIGKSTLANEKCGYVDLESGCFWHNGIRHDDWYIYYCQMAEHLSRQGYVVFVASHEVVRNYLKSSDERAICIYPSILLADEWKKKLHDRYDRTKRTKDYKAWMNAEEMYHVNISDMMMCGIPHAEITSMNYNLHDLIIKVIERNPEIDMHAWKCLQANDAVSRKSILDKISKKDNWEKYDRYNIGLSDARKIVQDEPPVTQKWRTSDDENDRSYI